ncbi:MAG TPA: arginine--tRNA ligase [Solirubrobacteraceae bacterium]|jgi:arginyl-tRNA synthetase|nr:arginine--tRNA ligase [Solirubrobacteraceae bacterium]
MTEPSSSDQRILSGHLAGERSPTPLEDLREAVLDAAGELGGGRARDGGLEAPGDTGGASATAAGRRSVTLERPRRPEFGDYSTNAALVLAPSLGAPPREVAARLGEALQERLGASLDRFEVAGPGFLNLFLADSWLAGALAGMLAAGEAFGSGGAARPRRILVEFVSANPTGPLHAGHARNAAYGDALARMLAFHGHDVEREFYINDAGSQIRKFGESIQALARGEELPADGYRGGYVSGLAASLADATAADPVQLGRAAVAEMVADMQRSLAAFNVGPFDHWQYESALYEGEPSTVAHTLALLEQHGHTYRSEGALWLRTTELGDDKDRVLVRSNGEHTYFASDIAYHQARRERGFARQIDVWGADHHGHVARMKMAYQALGGDPADLELLIMQLVHLISSGERAQMSKRAGEFVTLDELLEEIGADAARWYLLARSHDTTVDLDLDLAREQSKENPVYYVQYAHARIASILARAGSERVQAALDSLTGSAPAPLHASERALIELLLAFPVEVAEAAERRAPHRIVAYALELAQAFTDFYRDCRVVGAEPEAVESQRIALCVASRRLIARSLDLLGVSAPDAM